MILAETTGSNLPLEFLAAGLDFGYLLRELPAEFRNNPEFS
jgi:hypothetical protein